MSYVDVQAIVARYQAVGATLATLGQQVDQSGSPSDFAATLAEIGAELDGTTASSAPVSASAAPASPPPSSLAVSPLPTASLLGLGSATGLSQPSVSASALWGQAAAQGSGSPTGAEVVADASTFVGVPYVWGGTSPAGFDCSGLVQYVYGQLGVSLPRTSEEQATVGTPVAGLAAAQPGDLVFFAGSDGTASSPGHVGIYIGNGQMIDAPHTGTTVQIQPVGTPTEIRRIIPDGAASVSGAGALAATATSHAAGADTLPPSLGVPASLAPLFTSIGQRLGVAPALLAAVAKQESGFQPGAVSGAGAEGLMQLMPSTAAGMGVDPLDPAQAITGAATLLKGYLTQFGSVPLALAAYNAGPGAVTSYGGVPPYAETQRYVASITSMLGQVTA